MSTASGRPGAARASGEKNRTTSSQSLFNISFCMQFHFLRDGLVSLNERTGCCQTLTEYHPKITEGAICMKLVSHDLTDGQPMDRSEERRVGKEWRAQRSPDRERRDKQ